LALGLSSSAAFAQFAPPGGIAPYAFGAPETGVLGASAADSAAGQTVCHNEYVGRSGARTQCETTPPSNAPAKDRK
jgi:hypothetical protein